jgi:acetoin utilization deacetylase AcuC-like enzyme
VTGWLAMERSPHIATFYDPKQVCRDVAASGSISKSPLKPELVLSRLNDLGISDAFEVRSFPPFNKEDFREAHTAPYVEDFFAGRAPLCRSNSIPWSAPLADSVRYTNASLYHAQRAALLNPSQITFSPTSGFHHAAPSRGNGFCTFSGQVIAAVKLYREFKVSGAWIDLDAHFGNSIEDSRDVVPDLDRAIPRGCNLNPMGIHEDYLENLRLGLAGLKQQFLVGRLQWLAFAHGADSHQGDDIGGQGQLTTAEWILASKMVYRWLKELEGDLGRPIPLTLALFGGYRDDDYGSVIDLHVADLLTCMQELLDTKWQFEY